LEKELEALEEKDPVVFEKLKEVRSELERSEPNIIELFKTPLLVEDRAKLCQQYEVYKTHIPNTEEWLEARTRYNLLFRNYKQGYKEYCKFTDEEHLRMKEEEKELSSYDSELSIKYKILNLNASKSNKAIIYRRYEELLSLQYHNEEYSKIKHWLKWAVNVPHDNIKEAKVNNINEFITKASQKLDEELFGMENVKEQILLYISAKLMNPNMRRSNLGLVGPPGVGKTAIARMIAKVMEWGFEQISFGGMDKPDFLKGHEYTYIGAQPGIIVKSLKQMGHKNGVIFLDELDKAAEHPDIRAALLHLVDQSQNFDFKDNFLGEISIDLSKIWYVGSMNKIPEDQALADRWWIIKVDGYTKQEKVHIVEDYLIPKAMKNIGIDKNNIEFDKSIISYLIDKVCKPEEKGVRSIEKYIFDIISKIHFIVTHQDDKGKLPFRTSFQIDSKLSYPVKIDRKILEILSANKELETVLNMMYL
jgi:ATP-dependent Lon protease